MKNYISFVNDHSGSMVHIARAAMKDFNANITAVKDAASREMLDTVVSVAEVGLDHLNPISVMVSNPHVLTPKATWPTPGSTPLWTVTAQLIKMLTALPDADRDSVSFLVMMTTDGEATDGEQRRQELKNLMKPLHATGRWSFVVRVPKGIGRGYRNQLVDLGIPAGNIQEWDTTAAGMEASTVTTTAAMSNYFSLRASGAKNTGAFYADASQVNLAALVDITKKCSLYVVPEADSGIQIRDFILQRRTQYLKGAAFYQLTKTEARVSHTKLILVREQATGKLFGGVDARKMIGLPTDRNARLHPGDHKNYDIFIQSESINRKLVGGTGVVYWQEKGIPFTQEEIDKFTGAKPTPPKQAVVQLPKVPVTNRPTKSPIPVTPRVQYFETREEARQFCNATGKPQTSIQNNGKQAPKSKRWSVA